MNDLRSTEEEILRVWAVALAEREGESDAVLRQLALGEEAEGWRERATEKMRDPGDDPLRWVIQPLGI